MTCAHEHSYQKLERQAGNLIRRSDICTRCGVKIGHYRDTADVFKHIEFEDLARFLSGDLTHLPLEVVHLLERLRVVMSPDEVTISLARSRWSVDLSDEVWNTQIDVLNQVYGDNVLNCDPSFYVLRD